MEPKLCRKLKADATPEEWAAHLEYRKLIYPKYKEQHHKRQKEYFARADVKERRKIKDSQPDAVARRKAYQESERGKTAKKSVYAKLKSDPQKWAKRIEDQRKRRTGFSNLMVEKLLIAQDNKCAVCGRSFDSRQIRADHCHTTNTPRGLLCHHCNIIEGMLKSMNIGISEYFVRMVNYLSHPPISLIE